MKTIFAIGCNSFYKLKLYKFNPVKWWNKKSDLDQFLIIALPLAVITLPITLPLMAMILIKETAQETINRYAARK